MNYKFLNKLFIPLSAFIISALFALIAKMIMHNEILTIVFSLCMAGSAAYIVFSMYKIMREERSDEASLIAECSRYLQTNFGPGFKCSRALATPKGSEEKFPTGVVSGPLQIEGMLNNVPFRFRIVSVFEPAYGSDPYRGRYLWRGSILEWGTDYQQKEYIPGSSNIDGFDIRATMNMIQSRISSY